MTLLDWLSTLLRRRPGPAPPVPPAPPGGDAAALLVAHNAARSARGLHPLTMDPRLTVAAQGHADHMAEIGVLAHSGIGDGNPWTRIRSAGFAYRSAGENVALGYPDAEHVVSAWLADPPHAANVLGDYLAVGFGRSDHYWCADYARA